MYTNDVIFCSQNMFNGTTSFEIKTLTSTGNTIKMIGGKSTITTSLSLATGTTTFILTNGKLEVTPLVSLVNQSISIDGGELLFTSLSVDSNSAITLSNVDNFEIGTLTVTDNKITIKNGESNIKTSLVLNKQQSLWFNKWNYEYKIYNIICW